MPLRRSSMPTGHAAQLYRRLVFGTLVELNVLDTRQ
jgi:alkaline phosphatase D